MPRIKTKKNSLKPSKNLCEAPIRKKNSIGSVVIKILSYRQKKHTTLFVKCTFFFQAHFYEFQAYDKSPCTTSLSETLNLS